MEMSKENKFIKKIKEIVGKIPKKIKILIVLIILILIISMVVVHCIEENKKQKYVEYNGKNLKESKYPEYKKLIDELKEKHPNWNFTLFYTKLDWNEVIKNEGHSDDNTYPTNLIPDSSKYPEDWKCEVDKDKKYDNGTWLCASNKAIEYQMDPRNILNDENIFQFEQLRYVENAQTEDGIKEITEGTFLEGDNISKALIQAGKKADLDPYFIAARLIQEQGKNGTVLVNGHEYNEVTVYNPFNINAKGNSQDEILENAAQYAFEHGWSSLEKALVERNRLYEKRVYK